MDKVIILKGASGRGKTPTLHSLIGYLITRYGASIVINEGYNPDSVNDCFTILDIPDFGKVGVITYGDKGCEQGVANALDKCLGYDCHAVVGASHMQYYKDYDTVYKILWDFADDHKAKTVETTTLIKYNDWGQPVDEAHLNSICAENLANLLFNL